MKAKYPSEEQGGFDPIPTHPEPLGPEHTVAHPEEEPGLDEPGPPERESKDTE
jgi:hypothetical protein